MNIRNIRDIIVTKLMFSFSFFVILLFFLILFLLLYKSYPLLNNYSIFDILFSSRWNPEFGEFGLYSIIIGTVLVVFIALIIATPISILSAVYIVEYAPRKFRKIVRPFIDVLAGIPSVVYGLCAFLFLVPIVKDYIASFFGIESTGLCIFTAGVTLAVMIFPIIISMCIETFDAIPIGLKEASLSIGATKWETVKKVILPASAPGIVSAILLGFGRAFGETIAVNMVVGGIPRVPSSVFEPGQTLASLIISAFGEMMSIPLYESALMMVAFMLFIIILIFNIFAVFIFKKEYRR